jgi:hypothetical protein
MTLSIMTFNITTLRIMSLLATLSITVLGAIMQCRDFFYCYGDSRYVECRYAECRVVALSFLLSYFQLGPIS